MKTGAWHNLFLLLLFGFLCLTPQTLTAQEEAELSLEELYLRVKSVERDVASRFKFLMKNNILADDFYDKMERLAKSIPADLLSPGARRQFAEHLNENLVISEKDKYSYHQIERFLNSYDYLLKLRAYFLAKYHHAQFHELLDEAFKTAIKDKRAFSTRFMRKYKQLMEYHSQMLQEFEADLRKEPIRLDTLTTAERWRRAQGHSNSKAK